jgi:hypothetical protein
MKNTKKNIYVIVLICCGLTGCTRNEKSTLRVADTTSVKPVEFRQVKIDARKIGPETPPEQTQIEEAIKKMVDNKDIPVVGYWVGAFGHNKINVAIADVRDGEALGYTVCAGNYRPLNGTVINSGDSLFTFDMNEPGTDKYDGHFRFTINTRQQAMEGKWSPFKNGAASSKDYVLKKTEYVYSTDFGEFPETSSRLLTEEDVANRLKEELEVMRNEIYARHGYSFDNKKMRQRFDTTEWYVPMGIDIRANLTDIEVQNIDLLYQYEEYYEENYDDYGR